MLGCMAMREWIVACLASAAALTSLACRPDPPTYWDEGGAPLVIPRATLTRHSGDPVEIHPDGRVTVDGDLLYFIDRVGRVTDDDLESLALLTPGGQLVANDDVYLGRIGLRNASPPWSAVAWLRVSSRGNLVLFDASGEPYHGGKWTGCDGPALRTCTLISHLLTLARVRRYEEPSVYVGVGVGIWR